MTLRLLYLLFCQALRWLALLVRSSAAKDQVGLDHYQVRRWDAWYRHVTLVLVAQAFLAAVRAQAAPSRPAGKGGG